MKYLAAAVAERHHGAKLSNTLKNAHIQTIGDAQQDHDQNNNLQKPELAFVELNGFFIEIVPGLRGTANQVLMTNNSGNTVWGNLCDYKYFVSYTQNGNWTVPADVTKIYFEIWGGGGGGAAGGDGGAGMYLEVVKPVTPGQVLNITIGLGGLGAASSASNGGNGANTSINSTVFNFPFVANGGVGATPNTPGYTTSFGISGDSIVLGIGLSGSGTTVNFAERTAGQFVKIINYGNGGVPAPFSYIAGSFGGQEIIELSSATTLERYDPIFTRIQGAGGGGGRVMALFYGADGNRGQVIIHW